MSKTDLVVKSNKLIEAGYRLELIEQRIILTAIVEARERQQGLGDGFVSIDAKRFQTTFAMGDNNVYQQLKDGLKTLFRRFVVIHDIHPETGRPRMTEARWISSASYIDGAGAIQLRFAPEMVPFISRLEETFTRYRLEVVGKMSSAHAVRLYELLVQYAAKGSREMEITWLKQVLALEDDYPRIFDLKKRVLDIAVAQINKHSDINVSYTQRKTGRAVTHLTFTIKNVVAASVKAKQPVIDRSYVEKHGHPGESYDTAYRRLLDASKKNP